MNEPLSCGSCRFCCKHMAVDDLDPPKPDGKWCVNLAPIRGCAIYETRPQSCRDFECLWLATQREEGGGLDIELRPDRSKVMLMTAPDKIIAAKVADGYRNKLNEGPMAVLLKRLIADGFKVFVKVDGREAQLHARTRRIS